MHVNNRQDRAILQDLARRAMAERGLLPGFSPEALAELDGLRASSSPGVRDLRHLPWASIDNPHSRDLDQLTVAEGLPGGRIRILVAVADVDALVARGSALDEQARHNATSVYTAALMFPMLPEELSTDRTSLNPDEDRPALVVDLVLDPDGSLQASTLYPARVRNRAKLAYGTVAAWLEGQGERPEAVATVPGLDGNLRLQDQAAQRMLAFRHRHGALTLETPRADPVFEGGALLDMEVEHQDRAKDLIETFMVAANSAAARFLTARSFPSIRRVVRKPRRWERIVQVAAELGCTLPETPDSVALEAFLTGRKAADPVRFPDLSLAIVKLLGAGEYVAEPSEDPDCGHFGLAVRDYAHATAPNRRYADLVTQRLLKAAAGPGPAPYTRDELAELARHCTLAEDAAAKVERQVGKSAMALLLGHRLGEAFDAVVTGAAPKGTWVRLFHPPAEGRLVRGMEGLDVGDRVRVDLLSVDVEQGFLDFARSAPPTP